MTLIEINLLKLIQIDNKTQLFFLTIQESTTCLLPHSEWFLFSSIPGLQNIRMNPKYHIGLLETKGDR